MRQGFTNHILLGTALLLAACQSMDSEEQEEFADAVPVLTIGEEVSADPELAAQAITLPPPVFNPTWPQASGDADHALIHVEAPVELERAWRARVISWKAKGAPVTAPPVVGPNRLYFVDATAVVTAINLANGEPAWTSALTPDLRPAKRNRFNILSRTKPADLGFGGGVALAEGRVFVTSGYGFIAALDAETGEEIWRVAGPGPMRNPPTVANGLVLAVSISNEVVALDQETGEELWTYQSFEESARVLASAAPAVSGQSVVVPFSSGELVALDRDTGRLQWQAVISRTSRLNALSTLGDISGSPVVDRGAVFSVSQSGQMAGIDLRTGTVAWEAPAGGFHTPWLAGETIYSVSNRGELAALNRIDGRARWVTELPAYKRPKRRKGRIVWAGPVLAGGKLFLTGTSGELIAVSPQNGEIIDRYKLGAPATQPPVVAGNVVYVLNEKGVVEAFQAAAE